MGISPHACTGKREKESENMKRQELIAGRGFITARREFSSFKCRIERVWTF